MSKRKIQMTTADTYKLGHALIEAIATAADVEALQRLQEELDRADSVRSEDIPADVVTMNSKIRVRDMDTGRETVFCLVFPDDENEDEGRLSVLSPMGMAVLGYRVGDRITWRTREGVLELKIEEILYQPEAVGDFHL